MLVESVGSGKTIIANVLTESLTRNKTPHKIVKMNPKSFTGQEMFGVMNTNNQRMNFRCILSNLDKVQQANYISHLDYMRWASRCNMD